MGTNSGLMMEGVGGRFLEVFPYWVRSHQMHRLSSAPFAFTFRVFFGYLRWLAGFSGRKQLTRGVGIDTIGVICLWQPKVLYDVDFLIFKSPLTSVCFAMTHPWALARGIVFRLCWNLRGSSVRRF